MIALNFFRKGVQRQTQSTCAVDWACRCTPLLLLLGLAMPMHAAQDWRVQPVGSLQKLTAKTKGVLEPFVSQPAQLRAARGEWESFQVVVTAGEKELKNVRLQPTPLATHLGEIIKPNQLKLFRENYVFVEQPSGNRRLEKLWWPDALIPLELQPAASIAPRTSEVFWVAVQAPPDAAPGEYVGEIDITADGETQRRLFVSLQVEDVQMPQPTMRGTVAVYYDLLRDWYAKNSNQVLDEKLKKQYYEFLLDYRINAYDLPVEWEDPQAAKYLRDNRVLSVRLPPLEQKEKLQTALRVLRANNALHKNFYYWIDEPAPQRYDEVREATRKLHEIDPAIKHAVTVHPNQSLQDAVDIWVPNIGDYFGLGHLDFRMLAHEREKGHETWWYTMVEPKYPYPTWLLDDDALGVRIYGKLMAHYGITGFVYSMAHGWGPKPLENLQSYAGTNGDGTLLYPSEVVGGSGPMPSIRLMLLRDAIEDYELLNTIGESDRMRFASEQLGKKDLSNLQPLLAPKHYSSWRDNLFDVLLSGNMRPPIPGLPMKSGRQVTLTQAAEKPNIDGVNNEATWRAAPVLSSSFKRSEEDTAGFPRTTIQAVHTSDFFYARFHADAKSFDKDWVAIEIAPLNETERYRFVVTPRGNGVVERHTREGRFQIQELNWKFAVSNVAGGYEVEMQIPRAIVDDQSRFRFNALRQIGGSSTPVIVRAFPDAGDVTLMPLTTLE